MKRANEFPPLQHTEEMDALKAIQASFPLPNQSFAHGRKISSKQRLTLCFCNSEETGSDFSSSSEGHKRKQDQIARIAMLQAQKVCLTDFLDERSTYLTQFTEAANAEFDKIGENALEELDEASTRQIMEDLEDRMQVFEETRAHVITPCRNWKCCCRCP